MNKHLSKRQMTISIVSGILTIVLLIACYFFILQPKKVELEKKEAELKTEEALLSQVQGQLGQKNTSTYESTVMLQKQVPVKPLLESLILDIEKAEVLSGSFVESISFGQGADVQAEKQNTNTETETETETEDGQQTEGEETISLPGGIQKVSINLVVHSPSYYELEEFIGTLEGTERIMTVETISFSGGNEVTTVDQAEVEETLNYSLTVSAFYMPGLTELIDQVPRIDVPQPGNKTNPLSAFADK